MSRAFIAQHPDIIKQINDWSGSEFVITFKKWAIGDWHYGNTEGIDCMKGRNIDVIGTPHQPDWIYKLFAYSFGLDADLEEKIKPNTTVEHNGYKFRFTTFNDKVLRYIQFYMLESELEQSIGRGRPLRYDCTINVFANFPVRQANIKEMPALQTMNEITP
jgi:hypothetical protein